MKHLKHRRIKTSIISTKTNDLFTSKSFKNLFKEGINS